MSNRVVPNVYRTVISEVIENVRQDFDEVGVEEAVLQELLRLWEDKVATSRVADFSHDPRIGARARDFLPLPFPNPASASNGSASTPKPKEDGAASGNGATDSAAGGEAQTSSSTPAKTEPPISKTNSGSGSGVGGGADEDEINSDLDDDDDEDGADGEDGAGAGKSEDVVIALYEKVQRVKNKWKVTLKDGLVSVGGKEYLFAKCQGEFEW
ncbi:TFIIA-domain-containing protein [Meredithblackwellia eburnea MCA 4105]